jgi:hypothetical protein
MSTGTSPYIKKLSFYFLTSFPFHRRNISMGMWEHIKLGELPPHNTLGFFYWGRSLKIHIEIKRECLYREQLMYIILILKNIWVWYHLRQYQP